MAFRKRRVYRPSRRRTARRWTAQLADLDPIENNAVSEYTLVDVSDYAQNTQIEPDGPTFVRERLFLSYFATLVDTHTVWAAIYHVDSDIAAVLGGVLDPSVGQNLIDEDVLWWGSVIADSNSATAASPWLGHEIDIKAKRRLKASDIRLVVRSTNGAAGQTGLLSFSSRSLMVGNQAT